MVLDAPEDAPIVLDLGGLHLGDAVGRKQGRAVRQGFDLVRVDGGRVEDVRPVPQQGMVAPGLRRAEPAGEGHLATAGVPSHRSAGRHGCDLQSGARPEGRRAGGEDGPHERDLTPGLAACPGKGEAAIPS